jgi:hypothetical protein
MKRLFLFLIGIVVIYFYYYCLEYSEDAETSMKTRTLSNDGFIVFHQQNYDTENGWNHEIKAKTLTFLPEGYVFLDYVYAIKDTTLSTFHRDVTSSQHIYHTIHPVYTLIMYQYDGCFLSLCPGSHRSYPFVHTPIVTVYGIAGTCFLFDCDVLHAGCSSKCSPRSIIQYKVCHRDDLLTLQHLQGIFIEKKDECKNTLYYQCIRKLSYLFEFPINYIFYPLLIKKEDNGIVGLLQDTIPIQFYNNT